MSLLLAQDAFIPYAHAQNHYCKHICWTLLNIYWLLCWLASNCLWWHSNAIHSALSALCNAASLPTTCCCSPPSIHAANYYSCI